MNAGGLLNVSVFRFVDRARPLTELVDLIRDTGR